jgi:hypothetical protein
MQFFIFHLFYVVLVLSSLLCCLCWVHRRTLFFHVHIFLFPVFMSHVYFRFEVTCRVTSGLKGHVLFILSEGVMADLNQNIDMTKLKKSYKWSVVWQEMGLSLVLKKKRVVWGVARKMGIALVPQ